MHEDHDVATTVPTRTARPRLQLVRPDAVPIAPRPQETRIESIVACPSRLRRVEWSRVVQAMRDRQRDQDDDEQRRRFDRQEESTMNRMEGLIYSMSRFVFGLGVGLALTSAYVIVTSKSDVLGPRPAEADVVRLDPVVVTISAERFDAIQTEVEPVAQIAHVYGAGAPTS